MDSQSPTGAVELFERGKALTDEGAYADAIVVFTQALALTADAEIHLHRGRCHDRLGQHDQAIADFTEAIRIRPDYALAYHFRGVSHGKKDAPDKALADYDVTLRLDPRNAGCLNNRGTLFLTRDEFDRALADLDACLDINPEFDLALLNRANAHLHLGNYERAFADFDAFIAREPENEHGYLARGLARQQRGDDEQAMADYTRVLELSPDSTTARANRAALRISKGEWEAGLADLDDWVRRTPRDAEAYFHRGMAYGRHKDFTRARDDLSEAVRLDPDHADAYLRRAVIFAQLQDHARAFADLTIRLRFVPPDPAAYFLRGLLRCERKSWEAAVKDFSEALKVVDQLGDTSLSEREQRKRLLRGDAEGPLLDRVRILNARSMAYLEEKKDDEGLADLNEALRERPDDPETLYYRGRFFEGRGSYRAAINDYRRAIELRPDHVPYRNQIAWLLATCPIAEHRNGAAAVEHATRACELDGWASGNLMDTLAGAYAECTRFADAVSMQQRALQHAPAETRQEMEDHLRSYQAGKPVRKALPEARGSAGREKQVPWWKKKRKK
ncbi:MAG: tetratricopeptide repeat protein [Gemmataceae bacterium]|nr:tetratricopeptide repeat protein [Gemmataceae bacterium]